MALLFPVTGENIALEYIVNKDAPENLVLVPYKNNYTPVDGSTVANFTAATDFADNDVTLAGANWDAAASGTITATTTTTFSVTAGTPTETIYGYFMKRAVGGELVYAERFATAYTLANVGDKVKIKPKITAE